MSSTSFDPSARDSALQPSEQRRLEEANALLDDNKPAQAAPIFAKLAEVLISANQPRRAANLHAQAARAFAKSRNDSALMQARSALNLLLQYKQDQQASVLYEELLREFTKRKMESAAEALKNEFAAKVAPAPAPAEGAHAAQFARLPSNCSHCGAALRSEEVHWVDARTVECAYCGTPIRS